MVTIIVLFLRSILMGLSYEVVIESLGSALYSAELFFIELLLII